MDHGIAHDDAHLELVVVARLQSVAVTEPVLHRPEVHALLHDECFECGDSQLLGSFAPANSSTVGLLDASLIFCLTRAKPLWRAMPLLVPLSPESHVRGTVFEAWGCAPPTRTSDGRRIRRRIDDVRPLPNPIDSYVRSTESRKYAKHAGELVDANLVITLNFNTDVNLVDLVRRAPVALWMMRPAVVIKLSNPRVTCLLFASGKALLVGVRSEAHGLLAAWHAALFLRQLRVPDAAVHDFVVRNVTSTAYVGGS